MCPPGPTSAPDENDWSSPHPLDSERGWEQDLRPKSLPEFVGQDGLRENLARVGPGATTCGRCPSFSPQLTLSRMASWTWPRSWWKAITVGRSYKG